MNKNFVLDRHIPIALIFTLIFQAGAAVWWASTKESQDHFRDTRLQALETIRNQKTENDVRVLERLARIETRLDEQTVTLRRVEALLMVTKK